MRSKLPSVQGDITATAQWIERLTEVLMLVPLCMLCGNALFAIVPVMFFYRVVVDAACIRFPMILERIIKVLLGKKGKKTFIAAHMSLRQELLVVGLVCSILMAFATPSLAVFLLGKNAPVADLDLVKYAVWCFVPVITIEAVSAVHRGMDLTLSHSRGYILRWIIEQVLRLVSVIVFAVVVGRGADSMMCVVLAVLTGALPALGLLVYYEKNDNVMLLGKPGAKDANICAMFNRRSLPQIVTVLAEGVWLIPTVFFALPIARSMGMDYEVAKRAYAMCSLLQMCMVSIPVVMMFGTALDVKGDLEKTAGLSEDQKGDRITMALNRALKIIVPAGMFLMLEAKPLMHVLFGMEDPATIGLLSACGGLAILFAGTTFTSQVMAAMGFKSLRDQYSFLAFLFEAVAFYPLMKQYGFVGAVYADCLFFAVLMFMNLAKIKNWSTVSMGKVGSVFVRTVIAGSAMHGTAVGLAMLGLTGMQKDILTAAGSLVTMVVCGAAAYYMTGDILKLFRFRRIENDQS